MNLVLDQMFKHVFRRGRLDVIWADGQASRYGNEPGRQAALRFHTRNAENAMLLSPELKLGELYMDGELSFGSAADVLEFLCMVEDNWDALRDFPLTKLIGKLRVATRLWRQDNVRHRARANVAHHYDLDERLYRLFLDADMQYSCAYFEDGAADIDAAQEAKKRHLASKLALRPGLSLLDIGCGWGGLGLSLARSSGVGVTGVTLSQEQQRVASERAARGGLASHARFELKDYRDLEGPFDRIVSVGMFEHVGVAHYPEFFENVKRLLKPDGVAVLHSIGRMGPPGATNPWIEKYIFPGGYTPALSEVMPAIERSGLFVTDIEILRLHYAETLKAWRARFHTRWSEAAKLFDERFCRMWDFYLAGSEAAFRTGAMMVFQIQLTKNLRALPITRDYMFDAEQRLRSDPEFSNAAKPAADAPARTIH
ncbi:MAG: cyclopropane-fatty-acyl-phospholipid synthase family protein [Alphaproteobacteria bacterium]